MENQDTSQNSFQKSISILIPSFNEVNAISKTIEDINSFMSASGWSYEIVVIDDASTDGTGAAALAAGAKVLTHPGNVGYGGALRTGILNAKYNLIGTIDADCSYPAKELIKLLPFVDKYDMVVGARQGKEYWGTFFKHPARLLFLALAQFVVGRKIPDVNSGLRIMKKDIVMEMLPRLSRGFSFSTTITLSFLSSFRFVCFVPIEYHSRVGTSKVRYFRDTLRTLQLMMEAIVYYNPIKAGVLLMFFPLSGGFFFLFLSALRRSSFLLFASMSLFCWSLVFLAFGLVMFLINQSKFNQAPK